MKVALIPVVQFNNRHEAGVLLARQIPGAKYEKEKTRVLALPRGGVPVAGPIARKLRVPLELCLVRKIGSPRNPEFAVGALVEDGTCFLNPGWESGITASELRDERGRESARIEEQKKLYRSGQSLPDCQGYTVILVDDGMATGATMCAAVRALKRLGAHEVVVAVPVCSDQAGDAVRSEGASLIALVESDHLMSVGQWYRDFSQVRDEEVVSLLEPERSQQPSSHPGDGLRKMVHTLADLLQPMERDEDLAPLVQHFRNRKVVMLGESTHGTSEFYRIRDRLTRILLGLEGFSFVAFEGDWPELSRLHRYVRHGKGRSARAVMQGFRRWPNWMWANREMADFIEGLRHSEPLRSAGVHGLDLYSLFESMDQVLEYVKSVNPFLSNALRRRYACFDPYERDEIAYARSLRRIPEGCAAEVVANLEEVLKLRLQHLEQDEDWFDATQNARIVVNAENYYRALLNGDAASWNVRDSHMLDTLDLLLEKSERDGRGGKGVVWAHNTHVGDYRATDMEEEGYVNLGGLARRLYGESEVGLIGMGTWTGRTLAASTWGGREQSVALPPAPHGTLEACFHEALRIRKMKQGFVIPGPAEREALSEVIGHRAVGVVAPPHQEGRSTYVPTSFSRRYDAFIFIDETTALNSLHAPVGTGLFPGTWPAGT
jgi:erythromycin esterase